MKVPEMFREALSRKAFVDRLLQSNKVSKSSSVYPRARRGGLFEGLPASHQSNVVHSMTDIAIVMAQLLLPKDAKAEINDLRYPAPTRARKVTGNALPILLPTQ
jgi:hypothetical protein